MRFVTMMSCKSILGFLVVALLALSATAQAPIPNRPEGYPMGPYGAPVVLEIFVDLMCPDSAAAFPTYLDVIASYKGQVQSLLHFFPLPYHTNSFFANQGAHIIADQTKNASAVYSYASQFFVAQQQWYNAATENLTIVQVQKSMATWAASTGLITASNWLAGLADDNINEELRISWKYACSRGILATPSFLINGVALEADPSWTVSDWQSVINPLLSASAQVQMAPASVQSAVEIAANKTCPVGEPVCEYLPNKFECCLKSEACIKNVGCRCLGDACAKVEEPVVVDAATCPAGESQCEYLPNKFECCLAGENCVKNVGCRCLTETCMMLKTSFN